MRVSKRACGFVLVLLVSSLLVGCRETADPEPVVKDFGGLVCMEYSRYTGPFPEDGSGRAVEDVAAIRVHNSSGEFLDYAMVECQVGDQIGKFKITGLPPGGTVWALEQSGMTLAPEDTFQAEECKDYFFRPDAIMSTQDLSTKVDGNTMTVTNQSDKTLKNVCVYYKTVHQDGNYFGGITYMLKFDTLGPGESMEKQSAYFGKDSRIVRYSYQEGG